MHRETLHTVYSPDTGDQSFWFNLVMGLYLLMYFTLLPILVTILLNWTVFYFTADNYYHASWMMPLLLGLSAFIAGVLIRQKAEDNGRGGLVRFSLGMAGLILYAYITYLDIHQLGGIYSQFMPMFLRPPIVMQIYALPGIGFGGMLLYKYFSLKVQS